MKPFIVLFDLKSIWFPSSQFHASKLEASLWFLSFHLKTADVNLYRLFTESFLIFYLALSVFYHCFLGLARTLLL